ncbi:hypothetical protein HK096_011351, partial [Nowakowskiella sp. JEL0078]
DHWAYKKEAYEPAVKAGKILTDAGVKVAFKSDHPVLNAQHLIHEAAKSHHYGLSAQLALASVTSVPAELMGQGWRIGKLKIDYDADIVLWNRPPLELGATPLKVYVDGIETFSLPFTPKPEAVAAVFSEEVVEEKWDELETFTIKNIGKLIADEETEIFDATLVIQDGLIKCFSNVDGECTAEGVEFDLEGGYVVPVSWLKSFF